MKNKYFLAPKQHTEVCNQLNVVEQSGPQLFSVVCVSGWSEYPGGWRVGGWHGWNRWRGPTQLSSIIHYPVTNQITRWNNSSSHYRQRPLSEVTARPTWYPMFNIQPEVGHIPEVLKLNLLWCTLGKSVLCKTDNVLENFKDLWLPFLGENCFSNFWGHTDVCAFWHCFVVKYSQLRIQTKFCQTALHTLLPTFSWADQINNFLNALCQKQGSSLGIECPGEKGETENIKIMLWRKSLLKINEHILKLIFQETRTQSVL